MISLLLLTLGVFCSSFSNCFRCKVIDLGKDVPVAKVVEATKEHGAKIVGLSALMTTTVAAMEETIAALHAATDCRIVVGGAVLTKD